MWNLKFFNKLVNSTKNRLTENNLVITSGESGKIGVGDKRYKLRVAPGKPGSSEPHFIHDTVLCICLSKAK